MDRTVQLSNHETLEQSRNKWCQLFENAARMLFHICCSCVVFNVLLQKDAHTFVHICCSLFMVASTFFGGNKSAPRSFFFSEIFPTFYLFYLNQLCPFKCTSQGVVVGLHVGPNRVIWRVEHVRGEHMPVKRVLGEHMVCSAE